ncbi:hypothetical protein INT44_005729 [Umbelopsis vinacea]|uniref:Uncharacterized protein n=1 Tax=Umbelopsis vinacea TaxID=44442 RepID=A0A8H7Q0E5_9FUNG|nr:hypothetical protein INT44_005729 [Umbelopsis vinacea]
MESNHTRNILGNMCAYGSYVFTNRYHFSNGDTWKARAAAAVAAQCSHLVSRCGLLLLPLTFTMPTSQSRLLNVHTKRFEIPREDYAESI